MRVSRITLSNILGIEELDFAPGAITKISGRNGKGKSSVLEGIRSIIAGGHDASLIRNGADKGEVVLVLDDGREFRKSITPNGAYLTGKSADGTPIRQAKGVIDRLLDSLSVNPVEFLAAPPAKRAEWLLGVMPMSVSDAELSEAAGVPATGAGLNGLEAIARIRKVVYDERTRVNGAAREKTYTAEGLRKSLPVGDAGDISAQSAEAYERLHKIDADLATVESETKLALKEALDDQRNLFNSKIEEHRTEIRKHEAAIAELEQQLSAELDKRRSLARKLYDDQCNALRDSRTSASADVARMESLVDEHKRAEHTREIIAEMEQQAAALKAESESKTAALERLDALKMRLMNSLPIKGMEIRDGQIYVDGVVFDRLNTAKKIQVALKVAKLRAGECGLVLVDNLECLDSDTFAAFEVAAAKLGMQFVVTRVSDEAALKVETAT